MAPHKTITVNGRVYDAVTGLPIDTPATSGVKDTTASAPTTPKTTAKIAPAPQKVRPDVAKVSSAKKPVAKPALEKPEPLTPRSTTAAGTVHSTVQRSQTLNRRAAKKPTVTNRPITRRPSVGRQMDIAKSTNVARFAKHPVAAQQSTPVKPAVTAAAKPATARKPAITHDKPAQSHPIVDRALARTKKKAPAAKPTTAKEVKEAAITKALATPKQKPAKAKAKTEHTKNLRKLMIIGAIIIVILVALFAVYRLFPGISVGMASAQAGISATYPEYTPDGYSLSQPVTFSDGEVALKFNSNSNDNYYTVTQTRSSWDSSAVLDNVVSPEAGADYVTTKERGLTIYTYDAVAAWVNGGILYKIDSKAPLSGEQIRRIATSL